MGGLSSPQFTLWVSWVHIHFNSSTTTELLKKGGEDGEVAISQGDCVGEVGGTAPFTSDKHIARYLVVMMAMMMMMVMMMMAMMMTYDDDDDSLCL